MSPCPLPTDESTTAQKLTPQRCLICAACLGFFPGVYLLGSWLVGG